MADEPIAVGPPPLVETEEHKDWRLENARIRAEEEHRIALAMRNRVYLAKGPIVGAVLIANLITGVIVGFAWLVFSSLK